MSGPDGRTTNRCDRQVLRTQLAAEVRGQSILRPEFPRCTFDEHVDRLTLILRSMASTIV